MIIIGAKGLAKEVLEIFHQREEAFDNLFFYDDVSDDVGDLLYGKFRIIKNMEDIKQVFASDNRFTIGVGKPLLREKLCKKFIEAGGELVSAISPLATVGHYGTSIGEGSIIMAGTVITNDVKIGKACLINPNCVISHDTIIGDFVEVSPGVKITGNCRVGGFSNIGTGAILLPRIEVGSNVFVGAGAVVTKNVKDGLTVIGVPAKPRI